MFFGWGCVSRPPGTNAPPPHREPRGKWPARPRPGAPTLTRPGAPGPPRPVAGLQGRAGRAGAAPQGLAGSHVRVVSR